MPACGVVVPRFLSRGRLYGPREVILIFFESLGNKFE